MRALVEDSGNCFDPVASFSSAYDCFADKHKRKAYPGPPCSHFGIELRAGRRCRRAKTSSLQGMTMGDRKFHSPKGGTNVAQGVSPG